MARNLGITQLGTVDATPPLFYDEHESPSVEITLADNQNLKRGDLVSFYAQGVDFNDPVTNEANTGDGTIEITQLFESATPQTVTFTYDGAAWDVVGSVSGSIGTDQATGASNTATGQLIYEITAGATGFANGDEFTVELHATPGPSAGEVTALSLLNDKNFGVMILGRDTDATNGPEPTFGYARGVFNKNAIGNWDDVVALATNEAQVIALLMEKGIIVKEGQK